jgi:phosphoesterase RecJ-like protein
MNPISPLQGMILENDHFTLLSHVRPDGDAYGTSLGFALSLAAAGKTVAVYNEDGLSPLFHFLPQSNLIQKTPAQRPPVKSAYLAVDTASQDRLGATFASWGVQPDLNLDHHISNTGYGKINWIDPQSPASGEVLYGVIQSLQLPLTPEVAQCLYVGIMTDTGSFRYRQTTAKTLEVAAALIRAGADPTDLAQACYQSYPASRLLLQREVLNTVRFDHQNQIAYFRLTPEMFELSGAKTEETEGIIESLQCVKTVEVAFVVESLDAQTTRVSLRSRGKVDVQKIASEFGGGGHTLAAGIRSKLPIAELEQKLLEKINFSLQSASS